MNQGETIPRQMIKWLDSLDLAYSIRNVRRDLANGFIVAEILSRYYPKEVTIYSFDNGLKKDKRKDNWEQIQKVLSKKDFEITPADYEPIYHQANDAAFDFLCKLYEFLTKKKLKLEQKPKIQKVEEIPSYAKTTANQLAKDRELVRIVDEDNKCKQTMTIIDKHNEKLRKEKQDSNIIEYLVMKRRQQLEDQLRMEEEQMLERKKKYGNFEQNQQQEIKEIQLKSYKSSTSKKNKEQQGQLMEQKGIYENLFEYSSGVVKKDFVDKELTKLGIDKKTVIFDVFNRCEEVSIKTMEAFIQNFQENYVDVSDTLNNNFIDFKKFFHLFLKPIEFLDSSSNIFMQIITFYKKIAQELVRQDAQVTQMMFESIVLKDLLNIIIKYPNKREQLIDLFYYFCAPDSLNRLHLIRKIKEYLTTDLVNFINILAILIQQQYEDFDDDLYNLFFFYSFVQLDSGSPFTRSNCLKIINEISLVNYQPVLTKIKKLHKLINDKWWEVSAQILIICSNLLLFLAQEENQPQIQKQSNKKNREKKELHQDDADSVKSERIGSEQDEQNEQQNQGIQQLRREQQEQLIEIVLSLFISKTSQNILRIGLVYLAPVLNYYPNLCDRYLQILLEITDKQRETVLMTNPVPGMEEGQIVQGCFSFRYKLTSAPVTWNSVGIAQSMVKFVQETQLSYIDREHLEILQGCLYNPLEEKDAQTWIEIYEKLNILIFYSLIEKDLCQLGSDILKKIFLFEEIQQTVLQNSFKIFLKLLKMIYHPDVDNFSKENLLEFFDYLNNEKPLFKNYTYDIIKKFSEDNKNLFLKSNLIEFMNSLAKERRSKLNDAEILTQ